MEKHQGKFFLTFAVVPGQILQEAVEGVRLEAPRPVPLVGELVDVEGLVLDELGGADNFEGVVVTLLIALKRNKM